ncbi:MAG: hypothetical protein COB02_03085 [Candidatus Cloacimonadota bacterium]|nr:MAG: hypothetical protein COB02_03085 [Candidatus Cloacimonadota bacterium]
MNTKKRKIKLKIKKQKIEIKENGVTTLFFDRLKKSINRVDMGVPGSTNAITHLCDYKDVSALGFGVAKVVYKYGETYTWDSLAIKCKNGDKFPLVFCCKAEVTAFGRVLLKELDLEKLKDVGSFKYKLKISLESAERVVVGVFVAICLIILIPFLLIILTR